MTLKLKKINISYTDNLENIFAVNLYSILKEYVNIKVIIDYYSNVDYEIIDKKNPNNKMFLELKSRSANSFDSFFIGKTKIEKINKHFNPTLLIWNFNDGLFFCKCREEFEKYEPKFIQKSYVIEIDKSLCFIGIDKLKAEILEILHLHL
jgi:hypothetical protein